MMTTNLTLKDTMQVLSGVVCTVFLVGILSRVFFHPKVSVRSNCLSNVKNMMLGVLIYANDYDDRLPNSGRWMDDIGNGYVKSDGPFHDLGAVEPGEYGYAFRGKASGIKQTTVAEPVAYPVVFDSVLRGRNAHSELSSLPNPGRHGGNNTIGYLDGHAKMTPLPKRQS